MSILLLLLAAAPLAEAFAPPRFVAPHHAARLGPIRARAAHNNLATAKEEPPLTAATAAPPLQPTLVQWAKTESSAIAPCAVFYVLYNTLRKVLTRLGVSFPASIVGMLAGFGVLCAIRAWRTEAADRVERFFSPACRLFRAWLAAIFAPGLITLPLVMPSLPASELAAFFAIVAGGFATSLTTGALVATALAPRSSSGSSSSGSLTGSVVPTAPLPSLPAVSPPAEPYVPFPRSQQRFFVLTAALCLGVHVASGTAALAMLRTALFSSGRLLNIGLLAVTLGSFSLASTYCSKQLQLWVHPFLQCSAATLLACAGVGALSGEGYRAVLSSYATSGGGAWLSQLLGPCVVSFSLQLYAYRRPLMERSVQIVGSAVLSTFLSMLSSAFVARLCGLSRVLRLALLSRTTTTALAGEIGRLLGVAPALGLLAAFITALVAFALGKPLLARLGVTDPVVRGLAMSSTAHGGAVVSMSDEPEAFPFAVLMMNLAAAAAVLLLSLQPVRALLLAVAGA